MLSIDFVSGRTDAASRDGQRHEDELPTADDTLELTEEIDPDLKSARPYAGATCDLARVPVEQPVADAMQRPDTADRSEVDSGWLLRERYVLEQRLAQGGTAAIFRASDVQRADAPDGASHVAIKLLRPGLRDRPQSIARLQREFRQTHALAHPNVVRHYGIDCDQGTWFIAMELLTGEALGQRLRHAFPLGLPMAEALRIATACANALAYAHDNGVTHGDVKPDNVFLTAANEVRVLDFGAAPNTARQPADTSTAVQIPPSATCAYASPEVLAGDVPEARDDVFSLACVIYEMLAGHRPFERRGAGASHDAPPQIPPPPGLSTQHWQALAAGLAWHRHARPADVRQLLWSLGAAAPAPAARGTGSSAIRLATGKPWRPSVWARREGAAIGAFAALGVATGMAVFASQTGEHSNWRWRSPGMELRRALSTTDNSLSDAPAIVAGPGATTPTGAAPVPIPASAQPPTHVQHVSFEAASILVTRGTVAAAIPVRRLGSTVRRTSFTWRMVDGTAVAGRDYAGPTTGVARFWERQAVRTIYVPIIKDATAPGDRSFTLELTGASPGARLGTVHRIVVTIKGDADV
jgi:serine/threonine protein kinase